MNHTEASVSEKKFWRKADTERLILYGTIVVLLVVLAITQFMWGDKGAQNLVEVESDSIPGTLLGTFWNSDSGHQYKNLNNEPVSLPDLADDYILLVFFDPRCNYCDLEASLWQQMAMDVWRDDIAVVGVVDSRSQPLVSDFLQAHALEFPVILDVAGAIAKSLGVEVVPTKILLSKELRILQYWQGFSSSSLSVVEQGSLLTALGVPPSALPPPATDTRS